MRLQVSEILTLDGVMEAPEQWVFQYMDQEIGEDVMAALQQTDAMLFGRKTFQEMAAAWPGRTGDMADRFNSLSKYVVSSTLKDVTWNNSHVITGNIAEEVANSSMSTPCMLPLWCWGRESVSFKKGARPGFNWRIRKPTKPGCLL